MVINWKQGWCTFNHASCAALFFSLETSDHFNSDALRASFDFSMSHLYREMEAWFCLSHMLTKMMMNSQGNLKGESVMAATYGGKLQCMEASYTIPP